ALTLLFMGCSTQQRVWRLGAYSDPAFAGHTFGHVVVMVDTNDLDWRHLLESGLADSIRVFGVTVTEGSRYDLPTRDIPEDEQRRAMAAADVTGVLHVSLRNSRSYQRYYPGSTATNVSTVVGAVAATAGALSRATRRDSSVHVDVQTTAVEGHAESIPVA